MDIKDIYKIICDIIDNKGTFDTLIVFNREVPDIWESAFRIVTGMYTEWKERDKGGSARLKAVSELRKRMMDYYIPKPDYDGEIVGLPEEVYNRLLPEERAGYCVREDCTSLEDLLSLDEINGIVETVNKSSQRGISTNNIREAGKVLPLELDTDEAKTIISKAQTAGLIDEDYQWQDTILLASYFAYKVCEYLGLSKVIDSHGNKKTYWKPFETLFGYESKKRQLSNAKANWMRLNIRFEPTGYERVNALF